MTDPDSINKPTEKTAEFATGKIGPAALTRLPWAVSEGIADKDRWSPGDDLCGFYWKEDGSGLRNPVVAMGIVRPVGAE